MQNVGATLRLGCCDLLQESLLLLLQLLLLLLLLQNLSTVKAWHSNTKMCSREDKKYADTNIEKYTDTQIQISHQRQITDAPPRPLLLNIFSTLKAWHCIYYTLTVNSHLWQLNTAHKCSIFLEHSLRVKFAKQKHVCQTRLKLCLVSKPHVYILHWLR